MKYFVSSLVLTTILVLFGIAGKVQAQSLLDVFNDWAAYTITEQNKKTCYVRSKPTRSEPGRLNHGEVHFFVSFYPDQRVNAQPYFQVGYFFQTDSAVSINIDGKSYQMFTQGDGAWVRDDNAEPALVQAMIDGNNMTVSALSGRGNKTTYRFSLRGVTKAIEAARNACN